MKLTTAANKTCLLSRKSLSAVTIALLIAGCNSGSKSAVDKPIQAPNQAPAPVTSPEPAASILPIMVPAEPPVSPDVPILPLEPSTPIIPALPIVPSEPVKPPMPIFRAENVTVIAQQPFTGTTGGGDAWIIADSPVEFIQNISEVSIDVEYRYQPFVELHMIDHSGNEVCARYSMKTKSFGAVKPVCLWSNTRDDIPLEDFKQAYYGYVVSEIGVWFSGVDDEAVSVEGWMIK